MTDMILRARPSDRRAPYLRRHPVRDSGGVLPTFLWLLLACSLVWGGFELVAGFYRQQHCVLLFGHWLSVEKTTNPLFCQ